MLQRFIYYFFFFVKYFNINYFFKNNIRFDILSKGKRFILKCFKGIHIYKNKSFKSYQKEKPFISIIIPLFNGEKCIKSSILSIQNQNIINFEILVINDFSFDKSLDIINFIQDEDSRIVIINNKKRMGTLYSRSIGVLMTKGNYIFCLDQDDMFFHFDILKTISEFSNKTNFDIIGFKSIYSINYDLRIKNMQDNPFCLNDDNLTVFQPKLGLLSISENGNYVGRDRHIWGKCIKSELFKNGIKTLGKIRYSQHIILYEDTSMVFILYNIANSFKLINIYGIIHFEYKDNTSHLIDKKDIFAGRIFFLNIIYTFSKNNRDKNFAVLHLFERIHVNDISEINQKKLISQFSQILKKIFKCRFIKQKYKYLIKKIYRNFLK